MTEDQDNAGEVVAGAVRVALTAAGQLAEQAARRREVALREAERDSAARLAKLRSQLAAERELALRSVRDVVQRAGAATIEQVVNAWKLARSWDDPIMGIERDRLGSCVRERFGRRALDLSGESAEGGNFSSAGADIRDVNRQAGNVRQRDAVRDRVAELRDGAATAAVREEAAAAWALAAESHPTPVTEAARQIVVPSTWRRRDSQHGRGLATRGLGE